MKITHSLNIIYEEKQIIYDKLRLKVDNLIRNTKKDSWHYYSRLKSKESYALKLETGRIENPLALEDFFAATLVVENLSEIIKAIEFVSTHFQVEYRRPQIDSFTSKASNAFPFDDLRLYVKQKSVEYIPTTILDELVFELQIKTFLQHAWGIATHDLIYKTNSVNWGRERVAYQVRAILEQAEISISGADSLAQLQELSKENKETKNLNKIVAFISSKFEPELLPKDVLRLSKIIEDTLVNFSITLTKLGDIIDSETKLGKGAKTLNLSPYGVVIQSIINQSPDIFRNAFKKSHILRTKRIFVPVEVTLPDLDLEVKERLVRA